MRWEGGDLWEQACVRVEGGREGGRGAMCEPNVQCVVCQKSKMLCYLLQVVL